MLCKLPSDGSNCPISAALDQSVAASGIVAVCDKPAAEATLMIPSTPLNAIAGAANTARFLQINPRIKLTNFLEYTNNI